MNPFVLNAVVKNSWSGSGRYYSHSMKAIRVSKPGGSNFSTKIARRVYEPPKVSYDVPLFHYFQIGQLPPFLFRINELEADAWVRADVIMKNNEMMITVVADNGTTLTPRDIWLRKTDIDHNFIVAIFQNPNFNYGTITPNMRIEETNGLISTEDYNPIPIDTCHRLPASLDVLDLTFHFYSNANYFKGDWRKDSKKGKMLSCETANLKNEKEVSTWLTQFVDNPKLGWVNGNGFIYTINSARSRASDFVAGELAVFTDNTIIKKMFIPLKDGLTFFTDDGKPNKCFRLGLKGLLNKDDISVFAGVGDDNSFKGISVEVNVERGVRQISNIEIAFPELERLLAKSDFISKAFYDDIYLMFIIRQPGVVQPTPYSPRRLDLLDSLPIGKRNDILFGEDEFIPWKASQLFLSARNNVLYKQAHNLTDEDILDGYGLTGLTNLIAKNPIIPTQEFFDGKTYQVALADWAYREELTYRKDKLFIEVLPTGLDGRLLNTSYRSANFAGRLHFQNLPTAKCMETHLVKWYTDELSLQPKQYGDVVLNDDGKFFGFACYISTDKKSWILATKDVDYLVVEERNKKTIVWDTLVLNAKGMVGCVVQGGRHVHHITYFNHHNEYKDYAVLEFIKDTDGEYGVYPADIDLWMDSYLLIPGIDYVIKDHRIYLFAFTTTRQNQIRVRMTGLSPTGKPIEPIQIGFVQSGRILFGDDLRRLKNKQLRISIAGRMYHRDELGFGDGSKIIDDVQLGEVYSVKEIYPCIENYIHASTPDEWNKEKLFENQVVEYMSEISPITSIPPINSAGRPGGMATRKVISGFINYVVYNFLVTFGFLSKEIKGNYTKADTDIWLKDVLHLVDVDITKQPNYRSDTVLVLPHRQPYILLSANQRRFINFINDTYLDGNVSIDGYILVA